MISPNHRGFSLLELIMSVALSLLLFTTVLKIYSWQRSIDNNLYDMIYLQENSRLAVQILTNEIQTAGYIWCAKFRPNLITEKPSDIIFTENNSLIISHQSGLDSDQIAIKKMATSDEATKKNDLIIASNCLNVKIMPVKDLAKLNLPNAKIGLFIDEKFYVRDTGRKTNKNKSVFALYRQLDTYPDVELVDGVQQIIAQPIFNNQRQIIAVNLTLILTSPDGVKRVINKIVEMKE